MTFIAALRHDRIEASWLRAKTMQWTTAKMLKGMLKGFGRRPFAGARG